MRPKTGRGTLQALRARRDEIISIAAGFGASDIRVFGSVARDEDDEKSDIDFLVDFDDKETGFAYFGRWDALRQALTELLGRSVDVSDGASFKDHNIMTPRPAKVRDRILSEAVPL
jgi:predicted nucleotidyltransferase